MIDLIDKTVAIEHLLDVIEENRLVVLCGAGLSMAPPSNLPSANAIALDVKNKCISSGQTVPDNLELLKRVENFPVLAIKDRPIFSNNNHYFIDFIISTFLMDWKSRR